MLQHRKRKMVSSDGESDGDGEWTDGNKKDPKSNMWMQCNKCKYTTDYNAFMIHHVLQQKKKSAAAADKKQKESNNGVAVAETLSESAKPAVKRFKTESEEAQPDKVLDTDSGDSETVEMIAAEINDFHSNASAASGADASSAPAGDMVITRVAQHKATGDSALVVAPEGASLDGDGEGEVTIVSGMVVEGEDGQAGATICMMPIGDEGGGERQAILDETGEGMYVHVVDMSGQQVQGIVEGEVAAQHEDGTVEMVQVMWDQMVTNEDDGESQEINF